MLYGSCCQGVRMSAGVEWFVSAAFITVGLVFEIFMACIKLSLSYQFAQIYTAASIRQQAL